MKINENFPISIDISDENMKKISLEYLNNIIGEKYSS